MTRYIIKCTYTEGIHAGESYYLTKGGYVTDEKQCQWEDTTYKTKGIAQRVCNKMYKENELNRAIERADMEYAKKTGRKFHRTWCIYESETYEPYPVEL